MRKEIWLKIGQSNSAGHDTNNPTIYHDTLDAVHPKVFEFSRGLDKTGFYRAAPYGEIMAYRHPAQDDNSGIGFGQCFGKERAYFNPDLEQIIIINRGVGATSFSKNRWNVGDDLYNLAVNDLKLAMIKNPDAIFRGILWHQGEGDTISFTQEMYQNALLSMYNGIIAEAMSVDSERVDVIFVCGSMVEKWIMPLWRIVLPA